MFSGKNFLPGVLAVLILLGVLLAAALSYGYVQGLREFRQSQARAAAMNRNRTLLQALAADTMEYSKHDSSIDPILQSVGLKAKGTPAKTR